MVGLEIARRTDPGAPTTSTASSAFAPSASLGPVVMLIDVSRGLALRAEVRSAGGGEAHPNVEAP